MRNGLLLLGSTTLGLAGLVLLTVAFLGPVRRGSEASELLGKNVRYMQARALAGEPSMLQQQQKSDAMDSLAAGLAKGMFKNVFKPSPNTPQLCEGRGCTYDNAPIVPEQVAFECGGMSDAKFCLSSVQACIDESEHTIAKYYAKDKRRAREARPVHLCKCFVSNGCEPACNVAMYMVWSTNSGVSCPTRPPSYMSSANAFQYGSPYTANVMPTDISYDYFPEYPSPGGRSFTVEDMRKVYHSDDLTPQTLPPYHPWHWGQYQYPAADTYYHPFNFYSPFFSVPYRPYSYSPRPYWYNHPDAYNYNIYSDPYYWYYNQGYQDFDKDYQDYDSSYDPAWEQYGDYYYDPVSGEVVLS